MIVLKVRHKENLDELAEVIRRGRTLEGGEGGWQMPKHAQLGDLAIWYAASPDQEYRAYGWVSGPPVKPAGELVKYYGPVAGVRPLPAPVPRQVVAAASGFNEKGVGPARGGGPSSRGRLSAGRRVRRTFCSRPRAHLR